MINFENLDKMIAEKYISVQKHPTLDLYIYNYTQRAQFDRVWNNETLSCRGLIMDGNRNIVSRPFRKFFNYGELEGKEITLPEGDFTVTEKMDGSLGISYFDPDGKMFIATRGSFVSEQAKIANKIWQERYSNGPTTPWYKNTFLFEIIYPQNRIVVNYGDMEDLVLLAIIHTETGKEFDYEEIVGVAEDHGMPYVERFDGITDFEKIEERPNSEGYVVHFPKTGLRFKVKHAEYVRLHRILTGINAKRIWEILSAGDNIYTILDRVPDEFYQWVTKVSRELNDKYRDIENRATLTYEAAKKYETRKEQALFLRDSFEYPGIVFNMLDGKDYSAQIWKMIEPKYETPFKVDDA